MRLVLDHGGRLECADEALGEGHSGWVLAVRGSAHVVKLYKEPTEALYRSLCWIVEARESVAGSAPWDEIYRWPDAVVVRPYLGVRMPAIGRGFVGMSWLVGRRAYERLARDARAWSARVRIARQLAEAIGRLHRCGITHSDLSGNNLHADPRAGRLAVIDLDGLTVAGAIPPTVQGTPGYIAPEVLVGRGTPGTAADLHALAVLTHQLLLYRHPLHGPRVYAADAANDERFRYGPDAVFVDHPTDRSNRPIAEEGRGFWPTAVLGEPFVALFCRAFVAGLRRPDDRPIASEWAVALESLERRIVRCGSPDCAERDFPARPGVRAACPWCRQWG